MNNNRTPQGKTPQKVTKKMKGRTIFLSVCVGLGFLLVCLNMFRISVIDHEKYQTAATQIQLRETELTPKRGTIYDANMKVLAQSATVWTVFVSPAESDPEQADMVANGLGQILEVDPAEILEKLSKTNSYYQVVKFKVDKPVADQVRQYCSDNKLKGVNIVEDYRRYYPYGDFASTILGFCGNDNQGLAGLESYYNSELTGEAGRVITARNGIGQDMGTNYEVLNEARDGYSLLTTIDETIQHHLEKSLSEAAQRYNAEEGAVGIVMDIKTGGILGMAVYPAFDPNDPYTLLDENKYNEIMRIADENERDRALSEARQKQWRNKAVNDLYEPGSVFKIITASAALDSGSSSLSSSFYCSGSVEVDGVIMRCSQTGGHGAENFTQALINSCNPAFISIGTNMGKDVFYDYFYSFGLAEKTGIDLPGEQKSIYYTDETHTAVTLASSAFGQSNKITPIQMITAVSAAVNDGYLVTPHLVSRLLDNDGNVVKDMTPPVRRQVISEETSRTIRDILYQNVNTAGGNGRHAYVIGYRVGGKSGTSQKLDTEREDDYIASFVGVAPCDDPQVAILIMFDTPINDTYGYFGGPLAGTVVGDLMGEVLPYLGVEQVFSREEAAHANVFVPSVTGSNVTDASVKLQRRSLMVKVVGNGSSVVSQYPTYGASVPAGSTIILYTERGDSSMVTIPSLINMTPSEARNTLINLGLNIKEAGAYSGAAGVIVGAQAPVEGEQVPMGTTVTVTYYDTNQSD